MAKFKGSSLRKRGVDITPAKSKEKCTACNGSGRYDNNTSPKCSSCNGTGYKLEQRKE